MVLRRPFTVLLHSVPAEGVLSFPFTQNTCLLKKKNSLIIKYKSAKCE